MLGSMDLQDATDEEPINSTLTNIQNFYSGKTILVTGGTGLLGKLTIEKLLRTCSDLKKIYVLVRSKNGQGTEIRFQKIFQSVAFDRLKGERPNFGPQVALIAGDCAEPNLGLSDADRRKLIKEVNCIIHFASTVRFNEKLRTAVNVNVRATRDLLIMAKEMRQMHSFVHVSTAFSQCPQEEIDEVFYDAAVMSGTKLISIVDTLNDENLSAITPTLIKRWPNTYVYTEAVAEGVVKTEGTGLPVAILRPSMVLNTVKEPVPGWIDNIYGPIGITIATALGIVRTLHVDPDKVCDFVAADYVVNCLLAAGWNAAETFRRDNTIKIYNFVSSPHETVTWGRYTKLADKYVAQTPSMHQLWHINYVLNPNEFIHKVYVFFLHKTVAEIIDSVLFIMGKETGALKTYEKIKKLSSVITYFCTNEWHFRNDNTRTLWKTLSEDDKKLFDFDVASVNYEEYAKNCVIGARVYLLKDPLSTLPQARKKHRNLKITHYSVVVAFWGLLYLLIMLVIAIMFRGFTK